MRIAPTTAIILVALLTAKTAFAATGVGTPEGIFSPNVSKPSVKMLPAHKTFVLHYKHGKILRIEHPQSLSRSYIERKVLTYASGRVFPKANVKTLNSLRHLIAQKELPASFPRLRLIPTETPHAMVVRKKEIDAAGSAILHEDPALIRIFVSARDLNRIGAFLSDYVRNDQTRYAINSVTISGISPDDKKRLSLASTLVHPGDTVNPDDLNNALYALSQVPGFSRGDALITAGTALDTDNVLLNIQTAPMFSGSQIEVDNYGYAATGAIVTNLSGTMNTVLSAGDQAYAQVSWSGGMVSMVAGYNRMIDLDTRYGIDLTGMSYTVGAGLSPYGSTASSSALAALGVSGDNYSGMVWISHNFKNTPDEKRYIKASVFDKEFEDTYSPTVQNTRSIPGGSLEFAWMKQIGRIGLNSDTTYTLYDLSQGAGSAATNPFYYDTQGFNEYFVSNDSVSYQFQDNYSLLLSGSFQQYIGGGTLDPMLQATLGGMNNLAALPTASLFGNDLYYGQFTLNKMLSLKDLTLTPNAFFGVGNIVGLGTNYTVMGPGVGFSATYKKLFASLTAAMPIGDLPVSNLGNVIPAITGGNVGQGGLPFQLWFSVGLRD